MIPEIKPGLAGAVEYGTARRVGRDPTNRFSAKRAPARIALADASGVVRFLHRYRRGKIAVVVLLTGASGGQRSGGAGVAGNVYQNLAAGYGIFRRASLRRFPGQL